MAVPVVIKLQVEGGRIVQGELRGIGEAGDRSMRQISDGAGRASRDLREVGVTTGSLKTAMAGLGTIVASAFTVDMARRVIEVGDAYASLRDRIALAAGGAEAGAEAQRRLFEIAQATRQPLQAVGDLYSKIGDSARGMGLGLQDQMRVITMVGQALAINKTSAGAAAGALQQFGQMMGGAKVQAEEFNSILDGMRPVAKAMADGLSISIGQLRELVATGTLEPQRAIEAMLSQSDAMQAQFSQIGVVASEVMTQIGNVLFDTTGSLMSTTGATSELVGAMRELLAAVSDPRFKTGVQAIIGEFATLFADISKGVAESVAQIEQFRAWISGVGEGATGLVATFREAHPQIASVFDGWVEKAGFLQTIVLQMNAQLSTSFRSVAAEMSAVFQQAISQQSQLQNFAGASGFRAAQDAGTENAVTRAAFTTAERPRPIPSPFTPQARPQAAADAAFGAKASAAASAAQRALEEAGRIYAADEKIINDLLRQMSQAVGERERFIQEATGRLSADATDEQVAKVRELAAAEWDRTRAIEASTQKRQAQVEMEKQALALNRENASAAEQFAARMQQLDALKAYGLNDAAYSAEARKASEEAQRATAEGNAETVRNYKDSYSEIRSFVDQTYQGLSAGLSAMIMKNKFELKTFVDGIAQSFLQSGLNALFQNMLGGGTQGGGLFGMMFGGAATASAHGNVFSGPIAPFARGGVVNKPTIFPMARGVGLMGEAGPEGVLPLRRTASGDLGVISQGAASAPPQINLTIVNQTRSPISGSAEADGQGNMRLIIREMVGADIATPGTPANTAVRGIVQRYAGGR